MNTHDKYELPPLPLHPSVAHMGGRHMQADCQFPVLYAWAKSYALSAIESNLKRRGEPWGWTVLGVTYPRNWTYVGDRAERLAKRGAKELGDGFVAAPLFLGDALQSQDMKPVIEALETAQNNECGPRRIEENK